MSENLLDLGRLAGVTTAYRRAFALALVEAINRSGLPHRDFAAEAELTPHRLASLTSGRTVPTLSEAFNLWAAANWRRWME